MAKHFEIEIGEGLLRCKRNERRLERRVYAHLLLCMLACHVEFEMRQHLVPLLFDDERKGPPAASPATKPPSAKLEAIRKTNQAGDPAHSFQTLLSDLVTIARNRICPMKIRHVQCWMTTAPTAPQQKALDLLEAKLNIV